MHKTYGTTADALDLLSEEDLARSIQRAAPGTSPEPWWEAFQYDLYDWQDPAWLKQNTGRYAWLPIRLTKGYFMMVSIHDYKRMMTSPNGEPRRWHVKISYEKETKEIRSIYACRHGRKNEPRDVPAHRELVGATVTLEEVVDHKNGYGLDNRRGTNRKPVNLRNVTPRENGHNNQRDRKIDAGLPRGVERRGPRFGGKVCKRLGKKKVLTIRSDYTWDTPEPAARWYRAKIAAMHEGRKGWAHNPTSVNYPAFPPRLESEISAQSYELRMRARARSALDISF